MLKKITFNTIASSIGRILGGVLALFSVGLITRALGVRGFGEYATVVAYLSTFQILADMGLYTLLTKEISQEPDKEKDLISSFFTLRLIVAALSLFLASVLVFIFPYSDAVKVGVVFTASGFLFLSLSQIFLGVFQKYIQIYKAAIAEVLGRIAQLILVWYFFSTERELIYFLSALVVGSFVIFIFNFYFAQKLVRFKLRFSFKEWKRILKTTYPIAVSLVFTLLYFKLDTILLSLIKTEEDVGIYNAAYKILETIIFFPAAFIGLMLPRLSENIKESKEKFSKLLSTLNDIMSISAFPVVVGGILISPMLVYFIGGSDFLAAAAPLQVLFAAIGIIFYGTLYGNTVIALDLQKKAMWAYVLGFVFNFIANLIFIPKYSYMGAAWTTLLTELIVTLYLLLVIKKEVLFRFSVATTIKAAFAAAFMGTGVFYLIQNIENPFSFVAVLITIIAGGVVYAVAGYVFGFLKYIKNGVS